MPPRRARASSGSDSGDEDIVKLAAKVFQNEAEGIIPPRPPVRPASIAVSTKAIGPPTPDLNSPLPPIPNDQYSDETETSDEEDWQGSEEEEDRPLPPPPELPTRDSPQPANFVPPHPLRRAMSHRSGTSASGSVNGDALGVALPPGRSSPSKRDQKGPPVELPNPLDCTPHPMFYSSMGDVVRLAHHDAGAARADLSLDPRGGSRLFCLRIGHYRRAYAF